MSRPNDDVLAANEAFYEAFLHRDMVALEALWSRRPDVTCVHPGWEPLRGRTIVIESFFAILSGPNPPDIVASDASVHVMGESAFVVCTETVDGSELCATNVFIREGGSWKMVHHQAGPVVRRPPSVKPPGLMN